MTAESLGNEGGGQEAEAEAEALINEITPEERKRAKKEAKKGRKKAADARRKEKRSLTKSIESIGLDKTGAAGGESAKSAKTNRTNSSGKVVRPEKVAKIRNLAAEDPSKYVLECRYSSTRTTSVYMARSTSMVGIVSRPPR